MATVIYDINKIVLSDGVVIEASPLKIKYLREFMDEFENVKKSNGDLEAITYLSECARIAMKQYRPEIAGSIEEFEDHVNMVNIYDILKYGAGIKVNEQKEESVKEQAVNSGETWESLDLARLESEVFLLGIWKDYEELERNMSMPELMATLEASRELNYQEKKFLAAIQGVDLDANNSKGGQKEWEDLKAKVFSKGATNDSNDVLSLQGVNAKKAGFGIGLGLDYDDSRDPKLMV